MFARHIISEPNLKYFYMGFEIIKRGEKWWKFQVKRRSESPSSATERWLMRSHALLADAWVARFSLKKCSSAFFWFFGYNSFIQTLFFPPFEPTASSFLPLPNNSLKSLERSYFFYCSSSISSKTHFFDEGSDLPHLSMKMAQFA